MRALSLRILLPSLVLAAVSTADAQSQPTPTPRDTVVRDSLPPAAPMVDTTGGKEASAAPPELRPVRVIGKNSGPGYLRLETGSATKTPTLLRDIPQAVTVINRALIRDQGMQGMADVVRYVPGITMGQGEGNRDQPTIRGNSTTADFFVNGVRDDSQ